MMMSESECGELIDETRALKVNMNAFRQDDHAPVSFARYGPASRA